MGAPSILPPTGITPLRPALAGLFDYAGMYPPAALDLAQTIANLRGYAAQTASWALGRLVVPADRLEEMSAAAPVLREADPERHWALTAAAGALPIDEVMRAVDRFNTARGPWVAVLAIEAAAPSPAEVRRMATAVPASLERFVEVNAESAERLLDAIAPAGCYAKVRTGGLTAERFPSPSVLARFILDCAAREVPFKATAGLHHAVRGSYALTYQPDSPRAPMHGFVNVVVAAMLAATMDPDEATLIELLQEDDPAAFTMTTEHVRWKGHLLETEDAIEARTRVLRAIGTCSFEEPIAELRALGWGTEEGKSTD